jgi:Zn-dependent M16 (insulinase) family peptidase
LLQEGKPVFQELISKYLVGNNHRVTVEMKPDFDLETKQIQEEESRLSVVKSSMSDSQIIDVIELTRKLKEAQQVIFFH